MSTPVTPGDRAREYLRSPEFSKLWRYSSVSVISTVLTIVLLFLFFNVMRIGSTTVSNLLATSISSIPAYYLNRTWAWGRTGRSHLMREVVPFWTISIISIVLSTGAVHLTSVEVHHHHLSHSAETAIALLTNLFTYAVLWVAKFMVFNRVLFKTHHHEDDSDDEFGSHRVGLAGTDAV